MMPGAYGLSDFSRLHLRPQVGHGRWWMEARLRRCSLPPRANGSLWSTASAPSCPHAWHTSDAAVALPPCASAEPVDCHGLTSPRYARVAACLPGECSRAGTRSLAQAQG